MSQTQGAISVDTKSKGIHPGTILGVMVAGAFVALLNQTIINVALPKMMTDLNIGASTAQWLTTIYLLVNGILIPVTAFLMQRFSTRQLFMTAMTLFAVGTLVCGIGPNFSIILIGRVIQAAGAGILMPLMTNTVLTIFPVEKRGAAMGVMGIAMVFAPAVGPTLAGWLIESHSWRIMFFIILPIAIADIIVATFLLKNVSKRGNVKLDPLSVTLSTFGFGGLLYGFSMAGSDGWGAFQVIGSLAAGAIFLALFVWRQMISRSPMLEFRIFRYGMFSLTTVINVIITMALYAAMILVPIYLQDIRGFSTLKSGLLLLPGGILMGIMSPITGKLFDKFGARWLAVIGLAITTGTTFALSQLTPTTTYTYMILIYSARMFGMSMLMMPIMTAGLNQLPQKFNPHGTAMVNTIRMVSGAVGTAILITIMTAETKRHAAAMMVSQHVNPLDKAAVLLTTNHAEIIGINDAFLVATALTFVAFILAFFIRRATTAEDIITDSHPATRAKNKSKIGSTSSAL